MFFPNPTTYDCYQDLFRDFLTSNRQQDASFSYRAFAKEIGWPHSYLRDVIVGQRRLTVLRSIEFSTLAHYTPSETERLVNMALCANEETAVSRYFQAKLKKPDPPKHSPEHRNASIFFNPKAFAVYTLVASMDKYPGHSRVAEDLFTMELNSSDVQEIMKTLEEEDLITISKDGSIEAIQPDIFFLEHKDSAERPDEDFFRVHQKFSENLLRYLDRPVPPLLCFNGYAMLAKDDFSDLRLQGVKLVKDIVARNRKQYAEIKEKNLVSPRLFQYEVQLFPISRKNSFDEKPAMEP